MFASPTDYMLAAFGYPLLKWDIFYKLLTKDFNSRHLPWMDSMNYVSYKLPPLSVVLRVEVHGSHVLV